MKQANHGAIDNQQLLSIIERIEKLNEDTAAIAADTGTSTSDFVVRSINRR